MLDKRLRSPGRHHVLEAPEDICLQVAGTLPSSTLNQGQQDAPPMRSWVSLSHIPHPRRRTVKFPLQQMDCSFSLLQTGPPPFSTPGTDALKHFKILG